jgi:heme/copper-type cytochrome/quinol oxidase subunit 2
MMMMMMMMMVIHVLFIYLFFSRNATHSQHHHNDWGGSRNARKHRSGLDRTVLPIISVLASFLFQSAFLRTIKTLIIKRTTQGSYSGGGGG